MQSTNNATQVSGTSATKKDWFPMDYDLRDCWFPIAHSTHVGKRPVARVLHAHTVYLWREGERAVAAEQAPVKMASSQAAFGELTAGSGYYPVVERYGYVWIWYGNPDAATEELIPHIPYLPEDGKGIPDYMRTTVRFDGCSALSVENLLDLTHADFLHGEVVGGEGEAKSDEVEFSFT